MIIEVEELMELKTIHRTIGGDLSLSDRALIALAVVAVTFGVWCRVEGLTRRSLWLDEVATVRRVSRPTVVDVVYQLKDSPFPPLYYCALWFWTRHWGVSPASLRALPMVLGILALPATYSVWNGLIGRRGAVWGMVLLSTNAFAIWHSQDAKMYATVWLLATFAGGAFLHALADRPARRTWLTVYFLSNTALLLVSFVGIVPLLIQGLFAAFLVGWKRLRGRVAFEVGMAAMISSIPLLIWLARSHGAVRTRGGIGWIAPTSGDRLSVELIQHFSTFLLGFQALPARPHGALMDWMLSEGALWLLALIGVVVVVHCVRVLRDLRQKSVGDRSTPRAASSPPNSLARHEVGLYLALWTFLPPLGVFLFSILIFPLSGVPRYMTASAPGVLLLAASALDAQRHRGLALGVGLVLVTVNMSLVVFGKTHTTMIPWRDLVRTASHVAIALPGPGDPGRLSHAVSLVHRDDRSFIKPESRCLAYEMRRLANDENPPVALRLEGLSQAVRRGEPFMIVEDDTQTVPAAEARVAIERSVAAEGGPVPFALHEIETVRVFAGESTPILPNPLSRHSASLWLALPASR